MTFWPRMLMCNLLSWYIYFQLLLGKYWIVRVVTIRCCAWSVWKMSCRFFVTNNMQSVVLLLFLDSIGRHIAKKLLKTTPINQWGQWQFICISTIIATKGPPSKTSQPPFLNEVFQKELFSLKYAPLFMPQYMCRGIGRTFEVVQL